MTLWFAPIIRWWRGVWLKTAQHVHVSQMEQSIKSTDWLWLYMTVSIMRSLPIKISAASFNSMKKQNQNKQNQNKTKQNQTNFQGSVCNSQIGCIESLKCDDLLFVRHRLVRSSNVIKSIFCHWIVDCLTCSACWQENHVLMGCWRCLLSIVYRVTIRRKIKKEPPKRKVKSTVYIWLEYQWRNRIE